MTGFIHNRRMMWRFYPLTPHRMACNTRRIMHRAAIFIACLFAFLRLSGQHPLALDHVSEHLAIQGKHGNDGVMLRWAPTSFAVWQVASVSGYLLERAVYEESEEPFNPNQLTYTLLGRFTALPRDAWEAEANINDPLVAVAAQGLFGNEETRSMPGGNFADMRLQAEMQENRHAVAMFAADMSADAASALGLFHYDTTVEAGRDYIYRLRLEGNRAGFGIDTVYLYVQYDGIPTPASPVYAVVAEGQNERVDVIWDKEVNARLFTAFHVERSENGTDFIRLNELPITSAVGEDQPDAHVYNDYTAEIGKTYYYRVLGVTPFAELSPPGEVAEGTALDLEGPMPPQRVIIEQRDNTFAVAWEIDEELIVPDAIGWRVKRGVVATGPYQDLHEGILPLPQRIFTDDSPAPILTNYYRVYAVDTAFNETPSMVYAAVWVDSIPPAMPTGLTAMVDTTGIVTVIWDTNTEIDLQGYRVFLRDDPGKEWYQKTTRPIRENFYTDTVDLKSLNRTIEYTVIATDLHYNVSPYAAPYTLVLPDLVAPAPPRWGAWQVIENSVELNWYPSSSEDVSMHRLLRSTGDTGWTLRQDFTTDQRSFIDLLEPGTFTSFALMAIDSAGNASDTIYLERIRSSFVEKLPAVTNIQAEYLAADASIALSWTYPETPDIAFHVYRKTAEVETAEVVGVFGSAIREHTDKGPTAYKQGFSYYIKVIGTDGRESDWSRPYTVSFR